ncbi:hypothetical protein WA158_006764 [Blastocystis sp. Blastoise]
MSGSGYDMSTTTYSPEGRIFQVEYASKAVMEASTCVGINCKDGVVIGIEKVLNSPFVIEGSDRHVHLVTDHIGAVVGGYTADGRYFVEMTRKHATNFKTQFGEEVPPKVLSQMMASFAHQFTCYGSLRPLGISVLYAGYDIRSNQYQLYTVSTSGTAVKHFADSLGKGRQACKASIDKLNLTEKTCDEVLQWVTHMLCQLHVDSKKPYEIELGVVSDSTDHKFVRVTPEKTAELVQWAKNKIAEEEQSSDSSDSE